MARYRKIDVRIWGDERFLALSGLEPSGKALWLYLLTSPNTNSIPGLFRCGEAAMAEELGWPLKAFREAFGEVFREGLAEADWKARVIWIPKAMKYNRPESPNVVASWAVSWDEIPECRLKHVANKALEDFTEGLGEAFAKAFAKACPKPSPKAMPNQEQEQEQEKEQETTLPKAAASGEVEFEALWTVCTKKVGKARARKAYLRLRKSGGMPAVAEIVTALMRLQQTEQWTKQGRQYQPHLEAWLNRGGWDDEIPKTNGARENAATSGTPSAYAITDETRARLEARHRKALEESRRELEQPDSTLPH